MHDNVMMGNTKYYANFTNKLAPSSVVTASQRSCKLFGVLRFGMKAFDEGENTQRQKRLAV